MERWPDGDVTAICLDLDPCVCGDCGHGHHEACSGLYTLFSGHVVACRCLCHHATTSLSGCDTCGVGPDDECETGCIATAPQPAPPTVTSPLPLMAVFTPDVLEVIVMGLLNQGGSSSATPTRQE